MKKNLHKATVSLMLLALLLSIISTNPSAQIPADDCHDYVSRVNNLQKQVEIDQQAIRNLHFEKNVTEAEEWGKLSDDARQNLVSTTLNMYVDNLLAAAPSAVKRISSFNPAKANGFIGELQSVGVDDPYLFDAIRALGRVRGKPAIAAKANAVIDRISKLKDIALTSNSDDSDRVRYLQGIAMALGWFTDNPKVSMVVSDVEAITALAYSGTAGLIAKDRIDKLTELTEQDLYSLKELSDQMKYHVNELRNAKQDLSDCKNASAERVCVDKCNAEFDKCESPAWKPGTLPSLDLIGACADTRGKCYEACGKWRER